MTNESFKSLSERYPDEILYPFGYMIDKLGFDAVCTICEEFGGSTIYIPSKRRLFGNCVNKEILLEFDGGNYKQLSKKYDLCERSVRYIVDKNYRNKKTGA